MFFQVVLAVLASTPVQGIRPDDPRAIVRDATAAVEADRAATTRDEWASLLSRDSTSPAAELALATLARLTYDYPTADRLYRGLFAVGAEGRRYSAYARLGLAEGLYSEGRLGEIDRLLVEARSDAHSAGDRAAEGEALFGLARMRVLSQGAAVGFALLDSARRVTPPQARDVRASIGCMRAHIQTVTGSPDAPRELRTALAFARRVEAPRAEAICLRSLSLEYRFAGRPDSAVAVLHELEELRRRTRDRSRLAEALFLQGDVLQDLGAYGEVREVLHKALAEAQASHNLFVQASVNLALAAMYFRLNDNTTAAEYVNQTVGEFESLADTGSVMMARSWRTQVSIATGDFDAARTETNEVIDFFHREGDVTHESELYQSLADIALRQRDWPAAAQALGHAEALLRSHSSAAPVAELLSLRGRLALDRGNLASAETTFRRYLGELDSSERLPRYETRAHLAEIDARRGKLDSAERELRLAGDELDAWRAGLPDRELRELAFQASSSEVNDRNASFARVVALLAAGGHGIAAFELAEHRRGRALADQLHRAEALASRRDDHPRGRFVPPTIRAGAAELAASIPDDSTAVIEYATGAFGAPTTVFVLQRPQPGREMIRAAVLAPADSLALPIGRLVALLESGQDAPKLARALGEAVVDPVVTGLGSEITRLVIVPDGPLHRLPFDLLRLADGRYAVERFAISLAPSAAIVADLWSRAHDSSPAGTVRLLAMGDPSFPRDTAFDGSGGLPRLEGSADEVKSVARYVPVAEVRLRSAASAAYFKRADLTGYRIVHLATHAVVDEHAAARTALVLAPGEGETGFVGPGEIAALHLGADLVVLSACRTAGGVVVDGEGMQGLTAPLLQAGARSIVATGWRIGDRGTLEFIDAFYDAMARGLPNGQALRAAKLQMIHEGRPAAEWAAFTLIGDPSVRLPLRRPRLSLPTWLAVALSLAAILCAIVYGSRRLRK